MPRINQLPTASSVAQTDVLAIDTPDKTYKVPRSILAPAPYIATIPTGQWSGSGSDRYITVTASNLTENAMLYPFYDNASAALLNGPVWVIPAAGSFTIHTSAIPSGTVTISVLLAGIVGEAQYQVLADVYSTSQVDSKIAQSTAHEIAANTDLNTITAPGYYNLFSVSTLTNAPVSGTNRLGMIVQRAENERYVYQMAFENLLSTYGVFVRRCLNGTWSAWEKLATVNDVVQSTADAVKRVSKTVTIPAGTSSLQEVQIDFSDVIPTGKNAILLNVTLAEYVLPYCDNTGAIKTWVHQWHRANHILTIKNLSSAWNSIAVILEVDMRQ